MKINDLFSSYKNHPVLFIGTGLSMRYYKKSFTWEELLRCIAGKLKGNDEFFLDIKAKYMENQVVQYDKIASELEVIFNDMLANDRNGKFKDINDIYYDYMRNEKKISRFNIYICKLLENNSFKEDKMDEVEKLKSIKNKIGSIVTTNYDMLSENLFDFKPLIGNNILFTNPYGTVYKIHGCISDPKGIIITDKDYEAFENRYELINAQLISLFIHNPIIFLGYSISDPNVKKILETIFKYVKSNSEDARKIRKNFLLVEYDKNSTSLEVIQHDIELNNKVTIKINKIKTDNYSAIYDALSKIHLQVSVMDIRKIEDIVYDIKSKGDIRVDIASDIDDNQGKVLFIGTKPEYITDKASDVIKKYFSYTKNDKSYIEALDKYMTIGDRHYFPIFKFKSLNNNIKRYEKLKKQQIKKISRLYKQIKEKKTTKISNKQELQNLINSDKTKVNKENSILKSMLKQTINLKEIKEFLLKYKDKNSTLYRKYICVYDFCYYCQKNGLKINDSLKMIK